MATVVALHAHPDDEVLLTGGALARLAAQGHRVVIVVAVLRPLRIVVRYSLAAVSASPNPA